MYKNSYAGIVEPWKVELVSRRAKRWGIAGHDLDDVQQEVVLALLDFTYDPNKSQGATEVTAVIAVIDRRLAMIHRQETRYRRRIEHLQELQQVRDCDSEAELSEPADECNGSLLLDVQSAVAELPPRSRQVCLGLSQGHSANEIAQRLGISWRAVSREVTRIRRQLQLAGLDPSRDPFVSVEAVQ